MQVDILRGLIPKIKYYPIASVAMASIYIIFQLCSSADNSISTCLVMIGCLLSDFIIFELSKSLGFCKKHNNLCKINIAIKVVAIIGFLDCYGFALLIYSSLIISAALLSILIIINERINKKNMEKSPDRDSR